MTVRFIRFEVDAPANEELDTCIRRYSCSITRSFVLGSRTCETMGKRVHESFPTRGRGTSFFQRDQFSILSNLLLLACLLPSQLIETELFFSPPQKCAYNFCFVFFLFSLPPSSISTMSRSIRKESREITMISKSFPYSS